MSITPTQIILVIAVLIAAGGVQGMSGIGFGLVAVSLLSGIIPLKQASIMLVLSSLSMNLYILLRLRKHFSLERMKWMLATTVVGVPLGVIFLIQADESLLKRALGIILLATVVQGSIQALRKPWHPIWLGIPCGLFSGTLSGAFATGGPPAAAYVQSQQFDRFRYTASVQVPLAIAAGVRLFCLGATGVFTKELLLFSLAGVICAIAGAWVGLHLLKRLPDKIVRKVVLAILLVMGIKFIVFG